jgi:ribosomal protein S15P/S13E
MQAAPKAALTHAPWQGSLTLTAEERDSLHVDRIVTDALIDDLLPTVEYIAFFGPMQIDVETRRAWEAEARRQANTASAFCALLDNPTRLGYTYFVGRWIARGLPREDAERRFANLLSDLEELEAHLRHHANDTAPRRGTKADTPVDHLVRGAVTSWRRHTGQHPGTGDSSVFVKFCLALAALAELSLTRDRVRAVLGRGL